LEVGGRREGGGRREEGGGRREERGERREEVGTYNSCMMCITSTIGVIHCLYVIKKCMLGKFTSCPPSSLLSFPSPICNAS
jgi:hypothetical protein